MNAKGFLSLLAATILCTACDDPTQTTYTYKALSASQAPEVDSTSFKGTYKVDSHEDFFDGQPFVISFFASDYQDTESKRTNVVITPLGSTQAVEEPMREGSYSADGTTCTLRFDDLAMSYTKTGKMAFTGEVATFTPTSGTTIVATKIDNCTIETDEDDYYGTSRFLANADEDFGDSSYQFSDADGNGFYFPTDRLVCIHGVVTNSGSTLNDTDEHIYKYKVVSNRILIYQTGDLTYEDDPVATFNYFVTNKDGTRYLWANGKWYQQVTR